jgi:hypothetical protein
VLNILLIFIGVVLGIVVGITIAMMRLKSVSAGILFITEDYFEGTSTYLNLKADPSEIAEADYVTLQVRVIKSQK